MVKAREWSQKTREEVIALHKNGNGYKKIAKLLNIPRDTIGSIIRKFKLKGTVETLPGRGRKKILTATAVRYLKRNVEKNPRVTAKELKKDLSDVGTEVSAQTIRRALHNEDLHARTPRHTPLLTPKNKKSRLQYAKSHVDKPQRGAGYITVTVTASGKALHYISEHRCEDLTAFSSMSISEVRSAKLADKCAIRMVLLLISDQVLVSIFCLKSQGIDPPAALLR
ncbi:hypothetical protein NFI96_002707 [Prochilodus magdalenae]|nr:hypothetical protein NFI96_002707 [Prochilodus magdalenae]